MITPSEKHISLSLPAVSQIIIISFLFITSIITWQCFLPFFAERHYRDSYQFSVNNRFNFAAEELEMASQLAPWETQYKIQLGKYYEDLLDQSPTFEEKLSFLKKAETIYKESFNLEPINPWYANRIAVINLLYFQLYPNETKYLKNAEFFTKKASELDNQNPLFVLNYASFLHRYNRLEEAKKLYEKVIQMDIDIYEAHYNMADIYKRAGNLEKSMSIYMDIYKRNPDFTNISLAIASLHLQTGNYKKAKDFLEEALKNNPQQKEPLKSLASLYTQDHEWQKTLSVYQVFLAYFPESKGEIHLPYIQALANIGYLEAADSEVDQFLSINPKHEIGLKLKNIIQDTLQKKRGTR